MQNKSIQHLLYKVMYSDLVVYQVAQLLYYKTNIIICQYICVAIYTNW